MPHTPRSHATVVILGLALWLLPALPAAPADDLVFFGTHAAGPGRGLSVARFDPATGVLTQPRLVVESPAPAFFVLRPDGRRLYACNSNDFARGWTGETISAFAVDPTTGGLTLLNQQSSGGADPSYVTLDATLRYVLTANYKGGSIAVIALNPDGSLGPRAAGVQHQGSSVDPKRQTQPYAHCIRIDPTNRFALVADLGVDKLFVYRFDQQDGSLRPHDPPFVKVAPGSGPRHLAFDPRGRFVYLINELANTIITYAWDSKRGTLAERQTVSTLPAGFVGESHCAEILVHPNGKFVYASNRGHDTLAVFAVEARTGHLRPIEHVATQGQSPRNFAFDPSRQWIIVTNHASDNAMVFRVDGRSGRLTPQGQPVPVPVPNPFGVAFLARPAARSGR
jgi:6-phosphogluconolactonase